MIKDYIDDDGYPRRVQLPHGATDPELGIPVSVDWEALDLSEDLRVRLANELFGRELVSRDDYLKSTAIMKIVAALQVVLRIDANTIQNRLVEGAENGRD